MEQLIIWRIWTRLAFRFCFLFFVADLLPKPLAVISWVASRLFQAKLPLVVSGSGSGDKTYDWVAAFCLFCLAFTGTLLWSILDRHRPNYRRLQPWLNLVLRFSLGTTMLSYGFVKLVPLQMPYPTLMRLLQPFGEFSPMGVLWSSIGASPAYEMFTGAVEITAGLLVFIPRTHLLGALLCLAATTQIFALNMTYDVPVKLFSFQLVLRSLALLAPHVTRLWKVFCTNDAIEAVDAVPLFVSPRKNVIAYWLQILLIGAFIGTNAYSAFTSWGSYGGGTPKPQLYGVWNVERMLVDGKAREPLLTDAVYAKRVVFDEYSNMALQKVDGTFLRYRAQVNGSTVGLKGPAGTASLSYTRPEKDSLVLKGKLGQHEVQIEAKYFDRDRFELVRRGFHWVQEYPYNR